MPRGRSHVPEDVFTFMNIPVGEDQQILPAFDDNNNCINCWEWQGATNGNRQRGDVRPMFRIFGSYQIAYRVVFELVNGRQITPGNVVRHRCDNSLCCRPEHLEEGTRAQNTHDMITRSRHKGAHMDMVAQARKMVEKGYSDQFIANKCGYSQRWANDIRHNRRYASIPWPWFDEWKKFNKQVSGE